MITQSKTYLVLLIILISLFSVSNALPKKKRVMLIGIDGLLQKCWSEANTSAFEYMKMMGSYTLNARTAIEAVSGPGWSNILCGMDSESTGITDNNWWAPWFYGKPTAISPISGDKKPLPCVFGEIKRQKPETKIVSFYSWDWLVNLGNTTNPGTIDKEVVCLMDSMEESIICDEKALATAQELIKADFDFFFYYLGSLDETGHATKFCSEQYIERMSALNDNVLQIFKILSDEGILDETHIIFTTDHGASFMTKFHGYQNNDNLNVPWFIMGPKIQRRHEISSYVKNMDTAPTILKILGLEPNEYWRSKAVSEVFNEEWNDKLEDEQKFLQS